MQFDSEKQGGYIYFWSSGFVSYQLFDYVNEVEIVEDTTTEVGSRSYNEVLSKLVFKLKKIRLEKWAVDWTDVRKSNNNL